jgi:hypothetical protein
MHDRAAVIDAVCSAIDLGEAANLRRAAALARVGRATLYRWLAADPLAAEMVYDALDMARTRRYAARRGQPARPRVPCGKVCPRCGGRLRVRRCWGGYGFPYWFCERWPDCRWSSWRPLTGTDCAACGEPLLWSHCRKSQVCLNCRQRVFVARTG